MRRCNRMASLDERCPQVSALSALPMAPTRVNLGPPTTTHSQRAHLLQSPRTCLQNSHRILRCEFIIASNRESTGHNEEGGWTLARASDDVETTFNAADAASDASHGNGKVSLSAPLTWTFITVASLFFP